MAHGYRAVGWNRQKRIYDVTLVAGVALYVGAFLALGALLAPGATAETMLIRAFGTAALLLLHVILCIGPLCRLDSRFLPLLYNRRHMGVTMFLLAATHGGLATVQFHALGDLHPLASLLSSELSANLAAGVPMVAAVPFQPLGLAALVILFLMAATSHDFWLANLTPPVWKSLHMMVYVAYGLLILHVACGVLQDETHPALATALVVGVVIVAGLHLAAGWRERETDSPADAVGDDGFVEVCRVDDIPEKRARVVCLSDERVAVFRYDGKVSAISNVCAHQNGPLGEGRIVDGCVTCPWHGFQYLPDNGSSPPPFTEKVPTFRVRVEGGRVLVDPRPLPAGTRVEPALVEATGGAG